MRHKHSVNYTLTPNSKGTGYFAHVTHNECVNAKSALADASTMSGLVVPIGTVRFILDKVSEYLAEQLARGNCVTIGDVRMGLAIEGRFDAANAPFDPRKHTLKVVATPRKQLKAATDALEPVNRTATSHPAIEKVWCTQEPSDILHAGAVCEANGTEFADESGAKTDRVFLENGCGTIVAEGEVLACNATRLSFTLPAGIAPGEYTLVFERPNSDNHTRARARRKIRVE